MSMDDNQMREAIGGALSEVMQQDGAVLVKWVVAAEVIDANGERALWRLCPEGQKAWETLGMVRFIDHEEAAARIGDDS